jgi:phosphoserine phosphatase
VSVPQNVIALIFDFDDTLTDDSTTRLVEMHGIDSMDFWSRRVAELVRDGWDNALAYLNLILDETAPGRPLENLTNRKLHELGAGLTFYNGLPQLFYDLQTIASEHRIARPAVEFYVISGGLEEVIKGSSIAKYFSGTWGSCFEESNGCVRRIRNAISFTGKTKYIYAINKGIADEVRRHQYAVNQMVRAEDRRIPMSNMIYVGDGLTDVPDSARAAAS